VILIAGPDKSLKPGETVRYAARVDTSGPLDLRYRWTTNPVTVFAGQGGPEIEFERPSLYMVNVSVEIAGLPDNCIKNASETSTFDRTPVATRLDQFLGPLPKTLEARLKRINDSLLRQPEAQLFVVLEYTGEAGESAAKQKAQMIASLLKQSGADDKRIAYVLGKTPRESVQLWLVPAGADYPKIEK
jgi:hypothetical protein